MSTFLNNRNWIYSSKLLVALKQKEPILAYTVYVFIKTQKMLAGIAYIKQNAITPVNKQTK